MPRLPRAAAVVVGLIATNVLAGRLITGPLRDLPAEHRLNHDLRARGGDRTTTLANALSRSSDTSRAIALGVALTGLLLTRGRGRAAAVPGLAMALASATHVTSSALVGRERPALERLGTHQPTSSFPSGHVGAMTALAVVLGRLAEPLPRPARVVARAALVAYLGALGWSDYDGRAEVVTPYFGASGTGQINAIFPVTPQTGAAIPAAQASSAQGYTNVNQRL